MDIYNTLAGLHPDFKALAALDDKQKTKVDKWKAPHHTFSDKAMGGADKHRVEIPLKEKELLPSKQVVSALSKHGYHELNYSKGLVKDKYGRDAKIGKTLIKHGEHEAAKTYESDPARSAIKSDHKIIISRHPHDVAGMSTNQGWTSCMNMKGGAYKHKLNADVKEGTHVAYLVHKDDHNIEKPVARIALKPYHSNSKKTVLYPESKVYGTANSNFHKTVSAWTKKHFPTKDVLYNKNKKVYNDDGLDILGTGSVKGRDGTSHYKNGKRHRDGDKPAVEYTNGTKAYYKNGERHRDGDKPAIEHNDGHKEYYKNGKLHRDNKPAIEYASGREEYYKNGKPHRDGDLPAVEYDNGDKSYYKNGSLHRDGDLPAVENADGYKEYCRKGQRHRDGDKPAVIDSNGDKQYYKNNKLHRNNDKPAVEAANGDKLYHKNGKLHRDGDKPAVENADGGKQYYKNGELHRDGDKPAVENADGDKEYYQNGELHRDGNLPARISANGDKFYHKNGKLHRDGDLPAVEFASGNKSYYQNDKLHRDGDKPAVEYANGDKGYFKNGKRVG